MASQRNDGDNGPTMPDPTSGVWAADLRARLDELLDGYRTALHDSLDGLTEEQAKRRLVPSKTTLLGLVKHGTYVEGRVVRPGRHWPVV